MKSLRAEIVHCAAKIIWFKNWSSLKSIHSIEHFHVMMNDPDMDFVREITKGDVPVSERLDAKGGG